MQQRGLSSANVVRECLTEDLPKGEIWPPDKGLHPIPESWKEDVRQGYPIKRSVSEEVIKRRPAQPAKRG